MVMGPYGWLPLQVRKNSFPPQWLETPNSLRSGPEHQPPPNGQGGETLANRLRSNGCYRTLNLIFRRNPPPRPMLDTKLLHMGHAVGWGVTILYKPPHLIYRCCSTTPLALARPQNPEIFSMTTTHNARPPDCIHGPCSSQGTKEVNESQA